MRNQENMQIRVQKSFSSLSFMIFKDSSRRDFVDVVKPVEFTQVHDSATLNIEPTIRMPFECGQILIDDLWTLGFRPSSGVSSTGQDEAQKTHIADLRSIVRRLLNITE